jgi:flagellar protein FlaF
MSSAAYARVAEQIASPREIEAKALWKAIRKLQDAKTNWDPANEELNAALAFNRKLWSIFVAAALKDDSPQPVEVRQNIVNIGAFIFTRTVDIQIEPTPQKLDALIEINRNIAAGLTPAP